MGAAQTGKTRSIYGVHPGVAPAHSREKLPKRLVDTGGLAKKDRITHRIELTAPGEIDAEVGKWLKTAYELDAK